MVGNDYRLQCECSFDIDSDELFAAPDSKKSMGRTFLSLSWHITPVLAEAEHTAACSITKLTLSDDIWGPSKNTMLYAKPQTFRESATGHVIIRKREYVQKVVSILADIFETVQNEYANLSQYPIGGLMET